MIVYLLPDAGIFGGVKVGCQLADLLNDLGVPTAVSFPDGRAPTWFPFRAPVLKESEALSALTAGDWVMLTWPPDHARVRGLPGRRVVHAQGTDPRMDALYADPDVLVLTCWDYATDYARRLGADPVEIGIAISTVFFGAGGEKLANRVAYMPRRGWKIARACMHRCPELDFLPIEGLDEAHAAEAMCSAGVYLATSVGEQFGLPALEAMAAGCLVLSVPVVGGIEYLHHGENCLVGAPEELPRMLRDVIRPERARERERMRAAGLATAWRYHPDRQRRRLAPLLEDRLAVLRGGAR